MSSKNKGKFRHTLAFQLTFWYAGIFIFSSLCAFLVSYFFTSSLIHRDIDHELVNEMGEYSSLLALKGVDTLQIALGLEAKSEGVDKIFFRVLNENGDEISSTDTSLWGKIETNKEALKKLRDGADYVLETKVTPKHGYKTRILYGVLGPGKILQIGVSLREAKRALDAFRTSFGIIMTVLMPLAAVIGWFMSKQALGGVEEVTRTALQVSKGGALKQRVNVEAKGDEIHRLVTAFNAMLDRIDRLITEMRELTDNIAHDLRSPITRIRAGAEVTLTTGKSIEEYQSMATNTIDECDRLLLMINTTLDISEAEAGASVLTRQEVDIAGLVQDACELFQTTADQRHVTVIPEIAGNASINGDVQMLQRMVVNLLDNALKYTPAGGEVRVSVTKEPDYIHIEFSDTGIGIAEADLPRIFTRFYRCDQSRSQSGMGLGLSLALAIARAHGGDITVTSILGKGSTFRVSLRREA